MVFSVPEWDRELEVTRVGFRGVILVMEACIDTTVSQSEEAATGLDAAFARLAGGGSGALADVYDECAARLYASREDAADVVQEIFGGFRTAVLAGRMQETMAWRHLARAGLALLQETGTAGTYPATLPPRFRAPQLFCERSLRLELRPDGGAVLFLPGAQEASKELWRGSLARPDSTFRWELPAPAALAKRRRK